MDQRQPAHSKMGQEQTMDYEATGVRTAREIMNRECVALVTAVRLKDDPAIEAGHTSLGLAISSALVNAYEMGRSSVLLRSASPVPSGL